MHRDLLLLLSGLFLACILFVTGRSWCSRASRRQPNIDWGHVEPESQDFDWKSQSPAKYRPFKSTYHLTMAITRTNRQEWLKVDSNYLQSMRINDKIMEQHPTTTCVAQDSKEIKLAVHEMYDFVLDTITQRYPKYFIRRGNTLENTISGEKVPRFATKAMSSQECLRKLATTIQEDVFVLQYDDEVEEYRLRATTGLAGLGFEWFQKVGLKLTDIHGPVPGYEEKLQKSMNRYFHRIAPGAMTQRVTYSIMLGDREDLYSSGNASFSEGAIDVDSLDFENGTFVRLERQVLFRLPLSGFLGFTIRTFLYSLSELKSEGLGVACAEALEAWPEKTGEYKGRPLWGDTIIPYLRS